MKIAQYQIAMASEHHYSRQVSTSETLRAWVGDQRPDFEGAASRAAEPGSSTRVAISAAARQALASTTQQTEPATNPTQSATLSEVDAIAEDVVDDPKLSLLVRIIEALTGQKVRLLSTDDMAELASSNKAIQHAEAQAANQPQGWGVEYDYHEEIHEVERTAFTARGEIVTADGKRLNFNLELSMSREFYQQTSVSFRAGDAERKDPLVINFEGTAAQLSGQKFAFDIDGDGEQDNISFVTSASGFLALDKNGNGTIDDGLELFGARTGDGFAELAAYDADGNGWIDENDAVFAELRIWTKDADGNDQLSTLAERNVGALYLGKTATPFDLKDSQNRQHGQILSTGLYLSEQGRTGTLQQLDLFV